MSLHIATLRAGCADQVQTLDLADCRDREPTENSARMCVWNRAQTYLFHGAPMNDTPMGYLCPGTGVTHVLTIHLSLNKLKERPAWVEGFVGREFR